MPRPKPHPLPLAVSVTRNVLAEMRSRSVPRGEWLLTLRAASATVAYAGTYSVAEMVGKALGRRA